MSKSLRRVTRALSEAGHDIAPLEMPGETRTAQQAADAAGCHLDQIAKSIIFLGETSGAAILFVTAGGNRVDASKACVVAGEPLGKADVTLIRAQTGFAIGGVAPIGHLNPIRAFWDARLSDFDVVYAAAGTPRHIFGIAPETLKFLSQAAPHPLLPEPPRRIVSIINKGLQSKCKIHLHYTLRHPQTRPILVM